MTSKTLKSYRKKIPYDKPTWYDGYDFIKHGKSIMVSPTCHFHVVTNKKHRRQGHARRIIKFAQKHYTHLMTSVVNENIIPLLKELGLFIVKNTKLGIGKKVKKKLDTYCISYVYLGMKIKLKKGKITNE